MGGDERYRAETGCAALALERGDLLVATAPPAERWLLVESHVGWPRDALSSLQFDREEGTSWPAADDVGESAGDGLGAEVVRLCQAMRCRPALIRRHGRVDRSASRRWAFVDCRPGRESILWGELKTDGQLLDILADPAAHGTPSAEPIYLVCTHGRHDACCAVRGRPVATALAAAYPERTWECSHIGGDRFAANVVVLPHSLFYGQVRPSRVTELAAEYDAGLVVPELLRGRAAYPPHVQAAQHFARVSGASTAVDALHPVAVHTIASDRWSVQLAGVATVFELSATFTSVDAALTCNATSPSRLRVFRLH